MAITDGYPTIETGTSTAFGYDYYFNPSSPTPYFDDCCTTASSPKFKVGDIVVGNNKIGNRYSITIEGWEGIITKVINYNTIQVGEIKGYNAFEVDPQYFDLVVENKKITKNNIMNKITSSIKRLFNPSLQAQYKAGLINQCGELTDAGATEMLNLLKDKFNEDFTKVAEDIIAEEKEVK